MNDVISLVELNRLDATDAQDFFKRCCYCDKWAESMQQNRPYSSVHQLIEFARLYWERANTDMILEAFSAHAAIGDKTALTKRSSVSYQEQGHLGKVESPVISELREAVKVYRQRFGFIFIICATNKSADTILEALLSRLENSREQELQNGAQEQAAITERRLKKWVS